MRVFIAGATGVLGRRMAQQFTEKNHEVVGLARDENGSQTIRRFGGEAVFGNIFDADSLAGQSWRRRVLPRVCRFWGKAKWR